jgi:hypothetical protein
MSKARVRAIGKARRRRQRQERRRLLLASGAALSVALGSALSISSFAGVDIAGAAVAKAQTLVDLMHKRSPGQRTEAHLIKTKHKTHRVLAEREAPELPAFTAPAAAIPPVALFAPPLQPTLAGFPEAPTLLAEAFPPPAFYTPPIGGFFAPPPPGAGPPQQPPPGPPGQPPGLPEPSTWATMLLGFGLCGWMLRRRRERTLHLNR